MQRISSAQTFLVKKVFPVIWFGFLALFVAGGIASGAMAQDIFMIAMPMIMAGVGFVVFKFLFWNLADEVEDGGTFLRVRRGPQEERVPLANIINVGGSQFSNPRRIVLRLRVPGKFGDEITFIPASSGIRLNPFARDQIAERLIARIDRARHPS